MKRINRSMVCREVASLAKRIERGGIYSGRDGASSSVPSITCTWFKYDTDNDFYALVFSTEQSAITAMTQIIDYICNDHRVPDIWTLTPQPAEEGRNSGALLGNHLKAEDALYYIFHDMKVDPSSGIVGVDNMPIAYVFSITFAMDISLNANYINPDMPQISINRIGSPFMTEEYVKANYPNAKPDTIVMRFI